MIQSGQPRILMRDWPKRAHFPQMLSTADKYSYTSKYADCCNSSQGFPGGEAVIGDYRKLRALAIVIITGGKDSVAQRAGESCKIFGEGDLKGAD